MAKCRHETSLRLVWRFVAGRERWILAPDREPHMALRCFDCGHWLPLGPADDTPDALSELRAAELAHDWRTSPVQDPWLLFRGREKDGWAMHVIASLDDDLTDEAAPGYLARAIVRHDEGVRYV